jgi:hypothetical protein
MPWRFSSTIRDYRPARLLAGGEPGGKRAAARSFSVPPERRRLRIAALALKLVPPIGCERGVSKGRAASLSGSCSLNNLTVGLLGTRVLVAALGTGSASNACVRRSAVLPYGLCYWLRTGSLHS